MFGRIHREEMEHALGCHGKRLAVLEERSAALEAASKEWAALRKTVNALEDNLLVVNEERTHALLHGAPEIRERVTKLETKATALDMEAAASYMDREGFRKQLAEVSAEIEKLKVADNHRWFQVENLETLAENSLWDLERRADESREDIKRLDAMLVSCDMEPKLRQRDNEGLQAFTVTEALEALLRFAQVKLERKPESVVATPTEGVANAG